MIRYLILATLLAGAADAPLAVIGTAPVPATVNVVQAQLRIDPGAPTIPVFNPDFAARAGFKPGWIGTRAAVGPVHIGGKSAVIRLDIGRGEFKRRVTWFEAPMTTGADGTIGPGGLPMQVVRFELRAAEPGDRTVTLPLADFGFNGLGIKLAAGDETVSVRFTLDRTRSLATASGGAAIVAAQGGSFDGGAERMLVNLGIERPVRHVALAKPLQIGPLALGGFLVRTSDYGSAGAIPDGTAPEADPDEIVVTGKAKGRQRLVLEIGREDLAGCASIRFDKARKTLTLSCR